MANIVNPLIVVVGGGDEPTPTGKYVNFYDGFGELYKSIDTSLLPLEALPALPTISGYTMSWNKTLSDVNAMTDGGLVVCEAEAEPLTPTILYPVDYGWNGTVKLYFQGATDSNTLTIQWSDETTSTVTVGSGYYEVMASHSCSGTNPIIITPSTRNAFYLGSANSGGTKFTTLFGRNSSGTTTNQNGYLKKVLIGDAALVNSTSYNSIGTFSYCTGLENILIPKGITTFGGGSFYSCTSLRNIVIPSTTTSLGSSALLCRCYSLENAFVFGTATIIPSSTFAMCYSLENVVLPQTLITLQIYAFQYCNTLKELEIPSSVTDIQAEAFSYCYSLSKLVLSSSLNTVSRYICNYCYSLKEIYMLGTTPPSSVGETIFPINNSEYIAAYLIYVPEESLTVYQNTTGLTLYTSKMRGI